MPIVVAEKRDWTSIDGSCVLVHTISEMQFWLKLFTQQTGLINRKKHNESKKIYFAKKSAVQQEENRKLYVCIEKKSENQSAKWEREKNWNLGRKKSFLIDK